jgi:hypothetical protein
MVVLTDVFSNHHLQHRHVVPDGGDPVDRG